MADRDVQITFGADASAVRSAAGETISAVMAILPAIKDVGASFLDLGEKGKAAFAALKAGGGAEAASALGGLAVPALGAAKAVLAAGQAAWDAAKPMAQAADATTKLSEKYGVGVTSAQAYQGIATLLGGSVDAVAKAATSGHQSFSQYNAILDNYGVRNQEAVKQGQALGDALKVNDIAMMGVANTLTSALAPTLKIIVDGANSLVLAFEQSVKAGGVAQSAMDGLAWAVKAAADMVGLFGAVAVEIWDTVDGAAWMLAGVAKAVFDSVTQAIASGIDSFKTFGSVARDALTLNWSAIQVDISTGAARAAADVARISRQMGADAAEGFKAGADQWTAGDRAIDRYEAWSRRLWGRGGGRSELPPSPKPRGSLQESLQDGSARSGGRTAAAPRVLATSAQAVAEDRNVPEQQAAQDKAAAEATIVSIQDIARARQQALAQQLSDVRQAEQQGDISRKDAHDQAAALLRQEQIEASEAAFGVLIARTQVDEQIIARSKAGSEARIAAEKDEVEASGAYAKQVAAAQSATNAAIVADAERSAEAFRRAWDGAINPLVHSFTAGVTQMIEGTRSFAQVMAGIGRQILNDFITRVIDPMIEKWLWKEIGQTLATRLGVAARAQAERTGAKTSMSISGETGAKDITNSAAQAAADAYKAMAGIPIVGPALGAAAAGAVFAGVMAYRGMIASAAGGFDIPSGVNPLTQLHAEEMVLPATIANPLRNILAGPAGANSNAPPPANTVGDTHNHYYTIHAMDGPSFRGFLRGNADHLSTVLQEMGRRGQRTG